MSTISMTRSQTLQRSLRCSSPRRQRRQWGEGAVIRPRQRRALRRLPRPRYPKVSPPIAERQPRVIVLGESRAAGAITRYAARLPRVMRPGLLLAAARSVMTVLDSAGRPPNERYVGFRSQYYLSGPTQQRVLAQRAPPLPSADPWATHLAILRGTSRSPFLRPNALCRFEDVPCESEPGLQ